MSERKNIDKLFQEKFKDFEADPPEHTWPELERRLKEKKDRKIIPFWWRLSGIAAALLIGFLIADRIGFWDKNTPDIRVVIEENASKDNGNQKSDGPITTDPAPEIQTPLTGENPENAVAESPNNASDNRTKKTAGDIQNTPKNKSGIDSPQHTATDRALAGEAAQKTENRKRKSDNSRRENADNGLSPIQKTAVAQHENKQPSKSKAVNPNGNPETNDRISPSQANNRQTDLNGSDRGQIAQQKALKPKTSDQEMVKDNGLNAPLQQSVAQKQDAKNPENSQTVKPVNEIQKIQTDQNPVVLDNGKKLDSAAIANAQPNALEELLNEKENKVTKEPKLNRWQITSNVAPIYFGSTSGGSPIDSTFAGNAKDYNTQVSYGIGVNYAINKRLSVRAGVNKVSLNYDTNDVSLYAGLNEGGLENLDSPGQTEFINFGRMVAATRSMTDVNARADLSSAAAAASPGDIATDKFTGSINQKMGYIEVPVELSYAVVNRKLGVNVIAGFSTLFLNENKVMLTSDGLQTDLGEANNLNQTHFSTNVGLGVTYTFLKSFQASFEPIFKYQLNTFSKDSGDFKPYFFGLYTGVSFRF